jgi:hypothetical protein
MDGKIIGAISVSGATGPTMLASARPGSTR